MSRGFLPRGLSNTCPQVCATRSAVASHGQVSNKPKQEQTFSDGSFRAVHRLCSNRSRSVTRAQLPNAAAQLASQQGA